MPTLGVASCDEEGGSFSSTLPSLNNSFSNHTVSVQSVGRRLEQAWCGKGNCSKAKFSSGVSKPQIRSLSTVRNQPKCTQAHRMLSQGHWITCFHFLTWFGLILVEHTSQVPGPPLCVFLWFCLKTYHLCCSLPQPDILGPFHCPQTSSLEVLLQVPSSEASHLCRTCAPLCLSDPGLELAGLLCSFSNRQSLGDSLRRETLLEDTKESHPGRAPSTAVGLGKLALVE